MPKPIVVDSNLPIYKKGDKNQAGEEGKAVKIDKNVKLVVLFCIINCLQQLSKEEKAKYDQGLQNNAFNQYASDMISIHRSLPSNIDQE